MEFQLPKAYEEILDRSFEEEAILLQNDKALEILFRLNESGAINIVALTSDDEHLLFLLKLGYIITKEGNYFLTKKSNKFLNILGIKQSQRAEDTFLSISKTPETLYNYYDLKKIPDLVLYQNLKFNTLDRNIFIKISEPKTAIECKLMINCIANLNLFFANINNYLSDEGKATLYYQNTAQRKKYLTHNKNFITKCIFRISDFVAKVINKKSLISSYHYSMAEILGRLVYSGFEILENVNKGDFNVVIVLPKQKVNYSVSPQYGPLYKLKKIGYAGEEIFIYKFRTLYPYSEYLTDFIYKNYTMMNDGKIVGDFRISPLGKFLRKYWLDELPTLINLLKGDIKTIGVRPLSAHYLNLYPSMLRVRRSKFKPGLLPPYYVNLPRTIEEIFESEETYLSMYEKHPIRTDIKYFLKSMYNIFIKTARSS